MKLEQEEKPIVRMESQGGEEIQSSSRRNFLQKSSAAALVTSLSAQPVWGRCTVSGAMSGGSATQGEDDDPCVVPTVWGRSASFWGSAMNRGSALDNAFPLVDDSEALRCFIDEVKAEGFFIIAATPSSPEEQLNVGQALSSMDRRHFQLAAIWLNAYFGFFRGTPLPGRDEESPQDWVEHFFALSLRMEELGDAVFDAVNSDAATTQWSELPAGYSCS